MRFYNSNGIPSEREPTGNFYVWENVIGEYIFKGSAFAEQINTQCFELRNIVAVKNFGAIAAYQEIFKHPYFSIVSQAGLDAEIRISKDEFEQLISEYKDKDELHRMLYHYDVESLISTLQDSILETRGVIGEFYKCLNMNDFLVAKGHFSVDDGIQYASGPIVTVLNSLANQLFITMYSQLDFITKIVFEIENLRTDFSVYQRLRSTDILYGHAKKTSIDKRPGTVFEKSHYIKMVNHFRNEIVHNAFIDGLPKVYQTIKDRKIVEKFILLPDFENGNILSSRNRKRFFDNDTKLNEVIPALIEDFWQRLINTLLTINSLHNPMQK